MKVNNLPTPEEPDSPSIITKLSEEENKTDTVITTQQTMEAAAAVQDEMN